MPSLTSSTRGRPGVVMSCAVLVTVVTLGFGRAEPGAAGSDARADAIAGLLDTRPHLSSDVVRSTCQGCHHEGSIGPRFLVGLLETGQTAYPDTTGGCPLHPGASSRWRRP